MPVGTTVGMWASVCTAAACAGLTVWLLVDRGRVLRRAGTLLAGGGTATSGIRSPAGVAPWWWRITVAVRERAGRFGKEWLCLPVALGVAVLGESVLPLVAGAVAVPLVRRWSRAGERRRAAEERARSVGALCDALIGELRAGLQPAQALMNAIRSTEYLSRAEISLMVSAARFGGDVPDALRRAAREPGADGLAGLAACWRVSVDGGAGLAAGIDRLSAALRERREQRDAMRARLAGVGATVVVLALLPVMGLALGWALGADPLYVLLHTPAGLGCLAVGGLLECAGIWWALRIRRGGEVS